MREPTREAGVRYLLGELTEAESVRFEEELFEDPANVEALEALEAELYADYACGALEEPEKGAFERHLLATPEGRARLESARLFDRRFGAATKHEAPRAVVIPFRQRVVPALVAIAAAILAVLGVSLLTVRDERLVVRLSPELRSGRAAVTVAPGRATTAVAFELALDDEPSPGPFAITWSRDGAELPPLSATRAPGAATAVVEVAPGRLAPGRYELTLRGSDGAALARYTFRVD